MKRNITLDTVVETHGEEATANLLSLMNKEELNSPSRNKSMYMALGTFLNGSLYCTVNMAKDEEEPKSKYEGREYIAVESNDCAEDRAAVMELYPSFQKKLREQREEK